MLYIIFSALIAVADQLFKGWASGALTGQKIALIPGVIHLTYTENTGAAFSIFAGMRWLLVGVSGVAVVVLIFVLLTYRASKLGKLALAMVLGGAAGNLIDRVFTGKVADMFELEFMNFAIFNLADIFIVAGGILFIIYLLFFSSGYPKRSVKTARLEVRHPARETAERENTELIVSEDDLTETKILEEYDLERLLSQHDDDNG